MKFPDYNFEAFNEALQQINKFSETYADAISSVTKTTQAYQQIAESVSKPAQAVFDAIQKNQKSIELMVDSIVRFDLPKIVTSDILEAWAIQDINIDSDHSAELAEELAYDFVESVEDVVEQKSSDDDFSQLRLTSDGKLFQVDSPDNFHELSEQMERLLRALERKFTPTTVLVRLSGYTTDRSVRSAINKLNRITHGKLGSKVPIAIGKRGKGYRLGKRIRIHKLPSNLER